MTAHVYRVEGNALATAPDVLASAQYLTLVSDSPLDTGEAYLEVRLAGFAFGTVRVQLNGTTPAQTPVKVLRVNRAYYNAGEIDTPSAGTIIVKYGATTLAVIDQDVSAWDCVYSVGPGLAKVVLAKVTPGVTIKHRKGVSPHSVTVVAGDAAPGIGDFWAEGVGFAQFELESRP